MKIGIVSHSAELAGAERYVLDLVAALRALGHDACVVTPCNGPLTEELRRQAVANYQVRYSWWATQGAKPVLRRWARHGLNGPAALRIARYFGQQKCDVVFSNTAMIYVGAVAARILGKPHVWHLHELADAWDFDLGFRIATRMMRRSTARFVANSYATWDSYGSALAGTEHRVVYQGFDVPAATQAPIRQGGPLECVHIGTITPHKGQREAIAAINELGRQGVAVSLRIVGNPAAGSEAYFADLKRQASAVPLPAKISFVGRVESLSDLWPSADILLVTSVEGFGRCTVEAMLNKTVVVASDAGASSEIVRHGVTGLLFPHGNSEALVSTLANYTREDGQKLAERAAQDATRRFCMDSFEAATARFLERTVRTQ